MHTIKFAEELAHNQDLLKVLQVSDSLSLRQQETLQADLSASLLRQMSEHDGDWNVKFGVAVRRLREREYALGITRGFINSHSMLRPRMADRNYFVSGLVDARVEELKARLSERQSDFVTPNVFGNAPLYVVGK